MQIFSRLKNIVSLCLLCVLSTAYAEIEELPYIKNLLPKNSTEIEKFWKNYERNISLNLRSFHRKLEEKEGAQALRVWGWIIKQTLVSRTDLGYLIPAPRRHRLPGRGELTARTGAAALARARFGKP